MTEQNVQKDFQEKRGAEDAKLVLEQLKNVREWKQRKKRPTKADEQKQEGGE